MSVILADRVSQTLPCQAQTPDRTQAKTRGAQFPKFQIDPLRPVRQQLDRIEIRNPNVAKFIYKAIPDQCPFARDIKLFGRKIAQIPPLCKLNPLYDQLVGLRFRALCYLVDQCGMEL
ncbi:Mo-dependent nitrogenase C-terminal domain-containing protein [Kamptonema formosum]|uniref:Mo-dependent nitrogenase C-terminal domain-containing protein n=1 Tax=Kamptonema formosum TaxID=331992 RepID=UPI000369C3FD|nr:Mo-dependent nitrogenase C-terminal domain-containing protein [Oscillatoria sp. PCC 10802]